MPNNKIKIKSNSRALSIKPKKPDSFMRIASYDEGFPHPICLELCELNIVQGHEKYVIKTLKAFSNEEKFNCKTPHPLSPSKNLKHLFDKAKKFNCKNIYSLDVKNRRDTYRLYYCMTEKHVCKILELCSNKSH